MPCLKAVRFADAIDTKFSTAAALASGFPVSHVLIRGLVSGLPLKAAPNQAELIFRVGSRDIYMNEQISISAGNITPDFQPSARSDVHALRLNISLAVHHGAFAKIEHCKSVFDGICVAKFNNHANGSGGLEPSGRTIRVIVAQFAKLGSKAVSVVRCGRNKLQDWLVRNRTMTGDPTQRLGPPSNSNAGHVLLSLWAEAYRPS